MALSSISQRADFAMGLLKCWRGLQPADVARDEYYFELQVDLESGGPGLEWLNNTVFIASTVATQCRLSTTYSPCDSAVLVPSAGFEPAHTAPEADALSLSYEGGMT